MAGYVELINTMVEDSDKVNMKIIANGGIEIPLSNIKGASLPTRTALPKVSYVDIDSNQKLWSRHIRNNINESRW